MHAVSADEVKWPMVAAHHYIRSMVRPRVLVVLSFVLCFFFFFWLALERPFPEELRVLLKELNAGRFDSPLGITRRCMAEDPLPAPEAPRLYSAKFRNLIKQQQLATLAENDLSKESEDLSKWISDREPTNEMPEEGTGKPNTVRGLMIGRQNGQWLQWSDENQVKDQVQQGLGPAAADGIKEKTSESSAMRTAFPEYSEFVALNSRADSLPDVAYIPFEVATADMTLTGWEDEWFSKAEYDAAQWGSLSEPKIDFIYSWVNGSDKALTDTMYPYEVNSTLNDAEGTWLQSHRMNRYRDWDELRFSIRTVEKYAPKIRNKIQILVNSVGTEGIADKASPEKPAKITGRQSPLWLNDHENTNNIIQIIPHEEFFDESEQGCLPTFNSLTIESQIFNTKSTVDRFFALSDDMLLGKPHAASDLYSPLFGPTMGFKSSGYNVRVQEPPTAEQALLFGERPYHIYTSWLLNRRFGERYRHGPAHFGHSMGRSVTREAIWSFPRPSLQGACQRFRGQDGFQLSTWYATFHYTIERHREALLWSYIMQRSDTNQDGNLGWSERQAVLAELEEGMSNVGNTTFRTRQFYRIPESLQTAGLEAPRVNVDALWTSLDGPAAIRRAKCHNLDMDEWISQCLGPGFSTDLSDNRYTNPDFSSAAIFNRLARQQPECGDCLLKLMLHRAEKGLEPLLPHADSQAAARATAIKALVRYQYTIVEPDTLFLMATDAEQVEHVLMKRLLTDRREVGQLCINDDVATNEVETVERLRQQMHDLFHGLVPEQSPFEREL